MMLAVRQRKKGAVPRGCPAAACRFGGRFYNWGKKRDTMSPSLNRLKRLLAETMISDRPRFRREIELLERELASSAVPGKPEKLGAIEPHPANDFSARIEKLGRVMDESASLAERRREKIRPLSYDAELPIVERKDEIAELIRNHQVVIVCGETGSGKSTQLPKICLELGRGVFGVIGHTQPRRLAARTVARRIAEELGSDLPDAAERNRSSSSAVGFKIRFTDETRDETLVKVMTDGILLAESQSDPLFEKYDTIIIDEAHERSLNIDFLLGMMKRVLPKRRDLKLIITSATIDAKRFSEHFAAAGVGAPVVEVSGRAYPIEIRYRPPDEFDLEDEPEESGRNGRHCAVRIDPDERYERAFLAAVDELAEDVGGDMLIFMPTQRDILETAKLLKNHHLPGDDAARKTEILPLYARLSFAEQQKIFGKSRGRKIVIATNVAESSLTVPGIRSVLDTGTARISRWSSRSRTQRLPIEPISRASADQRAGRCGRIAPGVCIRLYSEEDYKRRDEYTTPEIRRTNLASVILQTVALKLGAIEKFPFLDPPARGTIIDGYRTLFELGALDTENRLTDIGRRLARLPLDPRIGRMILAAAEENALPELLVIAAALELQDPRERPVELAAKADAAHAKFADERSDFLAYLKIWDFWQHLKTTLSGSQIRKVCRENFLSFNRMREWSDIHLQLLRLVREAKFLPGPRRDDYDAIHRSILTGMLVGIAQRGENAEYNAAQNGKFVLWPGSGLFKKRPAWVVAAERVETSRRYLRTAARINPDWIEPLAGHLLGKTCFEPHWNPETGYVHAYQRITLFGLTIVPKRRVNFGPLDPLKARDIFIQSALVEGAFENAPDFFVKNQATLDEAKKLQAKIRAYDLFKGETFLHEFYQTRIPDDVYDLKSMKKWLRELAPGEERKLLFSVEELCTKPLDGIGAADFPDAIPMLSGSVPLEYRYAPGESDDGLTATVAPKQFGELMAQKRIGWLVPGLMEGKIAALLKSLPKEIRRSLVPIPDTAREIASRLDFARGDFDEELARQTSRLAGRLVTPKDFDRAKLTPELALNLRVIDDAGKILAEGRDPAALRETLGVEVRTKLSTVRDPKWNRDNIERWDFGALPEKVELRQNQMTLAASPALCDPRFLDETPTGAKTTGAKTTESKKPGANLSGALSLRLFDSAADAERQTRFGVLRLFYRANRRELTAQADWLPEIDRLRTLAQGLRGFDFREAVGELIAADALDLEAFPIPRCEGDFNRLASAASKRIGGAAAETARWIKPFLESHHAARLAMERNKGPLFAEAAADGRELFERLFPADFHLRVPRRWLREYPRYLQAVPLRYEGLRSGKSAADRTASAELAGYWDRYQKARERHADAGIFDAELETFRWMLEEYAVSLFAQKLGTSVKISAVRLEKQWEKITQ